jgi:hypothetical protein
MSFYGSNEKEMYGKEMRDGKESYGGKDMYEDKCKEKEKEKEKEYYREYESCECRFAKHLRKFVGETVTVFTESGGISGCGFTGFLIDVDCCFVRIVSKQGAEPTCPLGSACCDKDDKKEECGRPSKQVYYSVGSVSDIPIDKIVAFTHNAV